MPIFYQTNITRARSLVSFYPLSKATLGKDITKMVDTLGNLSAAGIDWDMNATLKWVDSIEPVGCAYSKSSCLFFLW